MKNICNCKVTYLLLQNQKQEDCIPPVAIDCPGNSGTSMKKWEGETNHVGLLEPSLSSQWSKKSETGWCFYQDPSNRSASYKTRQIILKTKQEPLGQVKSDCVQYHWAFQLTTDVFNMQTLTCELNTEVQ